MNSFGRILRVQILGESHGPVVGVLLDGVPSGLGLRADDLVAHLERRKGGRPGTTARVEEDTPRILSGVYRGRTTGTPILVLLDNRAQDPSAYDPAVRVPRPGHADLVGLLGHGGHADPRGGGHASGRLTAAVVAAGAIARLLLPDVHITARVVEVGGSTDLEASASAAAADGDSVGGVVECVAAGVPPALGEPWWDSVESLLAHAAFAIPGVKGFEIGAGFAAARMRGSGYADAILDRRGRSDTNRCGGALGGLTTGSDLVWRVAVRPAASIRRPLRSVDLETGEAVEVRTEGRHDAAIASRFPVILEAVTALVLADLALLSGHLPRVLPAPPEGLGALRVRIDEVDERIADLVARRLDLARATRPYKPATTDPEREAEVLDHARRGPLRPDFAEDLWRLLVCEARRAQEDDS